MTNADHRRKDEPWDPMLKPRDVKLLGKLLEELGELTSAVSRCLIQGIDECEPVTGKINRVWLEDEIADTSALVHRLIDRYKLDGDRMTERETYKTQYLDKWLESTD